MVPVVWHPINHFKQQKLMALWLQSPLVFWPLYTKEQDKESMSEVAVTSYNIVPVDVTERDLLIKY